MLLEYISFNSIQVIKLNVSSTSFNIYHCDIYNVKYRNEINLHNNLI